MTDLEIAEELLRDFCTKNKCKIAINLSNIVYSGCGFEEQDPAYWKDFVTACELVGQNGLVINSLVIITEKGEIVYEKNSN
jgi:hypothetical protein